MGAETQTDQRKHLVWVTVQTEIMLPPNHRTTVLPRSWGTHGRTSPRGYGEQVLLTLIWNPLPL